MEINPEIQIYEQSEDSSSILDLVFDLTCLIFKFKLTKMIHCLSANQLMSVKYLTLVFRLDNITMKLLLLFFNIGKA